MSRPHRSDNTYTGFRPRIDQEAAYFGIKKWGEDERVKKTFSAVINSILDGLYECLKHTTEKEPDGKITVEINLGRIEIE